MINYLAKKLKVRKGFLYSLIIVLIVTSYVGIIKKEVDFVKEKHAHINHLEEEIKSIEKRRQSLKVNNAKATKQNQDQRKAKPEIGMQSQLVLEEAQSFAKQVGLEVLGFKTLEQKNSTNFKSRTYDYVFEGSYESFISWLKLMENTTYFIDVDKLHIAPKELQADDSNELSYDNKLIFIVSTDNIAFGEYEWTREDNVYSRKYPFYPSLVVRE